MQLVNSSSDGECADGVYVGGLIAVIGFYVLILAIGLGAQWYRSTRTGSSNSTEREDVILAGREIGMLLGIFTMTATWVGGGYINGTAEAVSASGLVWTQAPFGYAISLAMGGLFFAKPMRDAGYITMLDPFQQRYGSVMSALLFIPAALGELFWSAAILSALGASLEVILGMSRVASVIISAGVASLYTVVGGLYSVAFTDVIQLICIFVGLWLGAGFAMGNSLIDDLSPSAGTWVGQFPKDESLGMWIDSALLLICGGIPWQVYFQRVLAASSSRNAQILSFCAAFGCLFLAIPAIIIGVVANVTPWQKTSACPDYFEMNNGTYSLKDSGLTLPMVLRFMTPTAVNVIGLGAISAAVMSSADSSVLSASAMFAHNVYTPIRESLLGPMSAKEMVWSMRLCIVLVTILAAILAIVIKTIYGLWYLCADLVFVVLFPQLVCVVYLKRTNLYGSLAGYVVGWVMRIVSGEPLLNFPAAIKFPMYKDGTQNFPFRTLAMVLSLVTIVVISLVAELLTTRSVSSNIEKSENKEIPIGMNNFGFSSDDSKKADAFE